jgi:hypothetical protein
VTSAALDPESPAALDPESPAAPFAPPFVAGQLSIATAVFSALPPAPAPLRGAKKFAATPTRAASIIGSGGGISSGGGSSGGGISGGSSSREVRVVVPSYRSRHDTVVSYRVFDKKEDMACARDLTGRFEKEVPLRSFPEEVARLFPGSTPSSHRLVTVLRCDQPYVVVRRVAAKRAEGVPSREYVKYFSNAAEGYREAAIHEIVHDMCPDMVVQVVEAGTATKARGSAPRVPPPCSPSHCNDIEFYLVTKDPGESFSEAWSADMPGDAFESFVGPIVSRLADLRFKAGFSHFDLHGSNVLYNPGTSEFRILDFGFSVIDKGALGKGKGGKFSHVCGSGASLAKNNLRIPAEVLAEFGGDVSEFGFFYDVGRVMLDCNKEVQTAMKARYKEAYAASVSAADAIGRNIRRRLIGGMPGDSVCGSHSACSEGDDCDDGSIPLDLKKCTRALFALRACVCSPELSALAAKAAVTVRDPVKIIKGPP